jgi:crotonobetainyl-CoA:carnitine CoA-transferase CaiB-like acyl-CoA transferase
LTRSAQPTPLNGLVVLEVGTFLAAPFATMQLADLGADVIKVESIEGGDTVRSVGPKIDGESVTFAMVNRNKRSLAVNLKSPEGAEIFRKLSKRADVVVENLRPGAMRSLGLGHEDMLAEQPSLIYASASGWGQDGPLSQLPGLDVMAQARSGVMSITGTPGSGPTKVGVPVLDLITALYISLAISAALHYRDRTGQGQFIDVSLYESGVSLALWEGAKYFSTGELNEAMGSAHQSMAPYQAIRTKDGYATVGAVTPKTWISFCGALELKSLRDDDRYRDASARFANRHLLIPAIEEVTARMTTHEVISTLDTAGVPCAPIANYGEVFTDDHLVDRNFFWDAPHTRIGPVRQLGSPMRFSRTPTVRMNAGPSLGSDTRSILQSLGYTPDKIDRLIQERVIATSA